MDRPTAEHNRRLAQFVCHENMARFRRKLTTESDEAECAMLVRLLSEEHDKLRSVRD
jgi:hypothetical protein